MSQCTRNKCAVPQGTRTSSSRIEDAGIVFENRHFSILELSTTLARSAIAGKVDLALKQQRDLLTTMREQIATIDQLLARVKDDMNVRYTLERHRAEYEKLLRGMQEDERLTRL